MQRLRIVGMCRISSGNETEKTLDFSRKGVFLQQSALKFYSQNHQIQRSGTAIVNPASARWLIVTCSCFSSPPMASRHGRHRFPPPLGSSRVILRPWPRSSVTLADTMAALCSPSKLYSALRQGTMGALFSLGRPGSRQICWQVLVWLELRTVHGSRPICWAHVLFGS